MGSIYKRGNRFYAQFQVNGIRRQLSLLTSDRRTARHLLTQLEKAADAREWNPARDSLDDFLHPQQVPRTLSEQVSRFIDSRVLLSPKTIATYEQVLYLYLKEGANLEQFLSRRSGATRQKYYRHVRVFYSWCIKQGWINESPCERISLPRTPVKEAHFFKRSEIDSLVSTIEQHGSAKESGYLPAMILFVCQTGMRLSEVCALRRDWIREQRIYLECSSSFRTKSGRDERIYLTKEASAILDDVPIAGSFVFLCPTPMQVSKRFLYWRRKAGLRAGSFHSLRHTCAAWMAMSGTSAYVIKKHLRHSSITVTERYMHLVPNRESDMIESALNNINHS